MSDREGDELVVVIYTVGDRSVAIVVDEIVDIVDEDTEFHDEVTDHGVLGSTLVRDRIVEVLDVRAAILSADPTFYADRGGPTRAPGGDVSARLVTFNLDGRLFGVEVNAVQEVLRGQPQTRIPLAPDTRLRPDQPARPGDHRGRAAGAPRPARPPTTTTEPMLVVVRVAGETIALLVDTHRRGHGRRRRPVRAAAGHPHRPVRELLHGAYKLDGQLLLALDVDSAVAA